ncbi:MAG: FKBP-type peptidyl-prolyl cis-trans isomerase, partial [Spirochaetia bacterium]|nr:FKBP-type peptidyl-prolyl cis-trans isomerase [Spirochaetia bacterium]
TLYEVQTQLLRIAQEELEALAQKNLQDAEEFLEANKSREQVQSTPSGLQYQILVKSEGERPSETSIVEIDYKIMLLNGTVIDNSFERGQSSSFQLQAIMVPGFIEGVKLMQVGSTYRFWIHPDLAYGKEGTQAVEPNSLLLVEVELKEIN